LAIVLGNNAEDAFRQSMLMSQGNLSIMWSNGLVGGITTLSMIMLFWPLIAKLIHAVRPARPDKLAEQRPVD
jgi:putative tricarboxylic transport membrane protein